MNLEQEIIDAANEVTEAKLAVVEKEQALRDLVRRVTSSNTSEERVEKKPKTKHVARKSTEKKSDPVVPGFPPPGVRSPVKQKIIDVLRASTVPLSIAVIADRAGATTTNTYYHLTTLRDEGTVRLLEDGYELVKGYLDAANTEKGAA